MSAPCEAIERWGMVSLNPRVHSSKHGEFSTVWYVLKSWLLTTFSTYIGVTWRCGAVMARHGGHEPEKTIVKLKFSLGSEVRGGWWGKSPPVSDRKLNRSNIY